MNAGHTYQLINYAASEYSSFSDILKRSPSPAFTPNISQKKRRINARRRQSFPVR